jgi:hypothetical protein
VLCGALERGERGRRLGEQRAAGGGQLDPSARAQEQWRAELVLELADLVAQRRLRDVQARGRAAEVELLGDGEEVAQQARLEVDRRRLSVGDDWVLDGREVQP